MSQYDTEKNHEITVVKRYHQDVTKKLKTSYILVAWGRNWYYAFQ